MTASGTVGDVIADYPESLDRQKFEVRAHRALDRAVGEKSAGKQRIGEGVADDRARGRLSDIILASKQQRQDAGFKGVTRIRVVAPEQGAAQERDSRALQAPRHHAGEVQRRLRVPRRGTGLAQREVRCVGQSHNTVQVGERSSHLLSAPR
jgi:hypothetical protein